jgi:hypothetical protein
MVLDLGKYFLLTWSNEEMAMDYVDCALFPVGLGPIVHFASNRSLTNRGYFPHAGLGHGVSIGSAGFQCVDIWFFNWCNGDFFEH